MPSLCPAYVQPLLSTKKSSVPPSSLFSKLYRPSKQKGPEKGPFFVPFALRLASAGTVEHKSCQSGRSLRASWANGQGLRAGESGPKLSGQVGMPSTRPSECVFLFCGKELCRGSLMLNGRCYLFVGCSDGFRGAFCVYKHVELLSKEIEEKRRTSQPQPMVTSRMHQIPQVGSPSNPRC